MHHKDELNFKATGTITMAVLCSRILGVIREVLLNDLFGAGLMGIFLVAFRVPNLLRDLFAEGVLSISFITVFSKTIEKKGEQAAWQLASKIFTLTSVIMGLISLLGIVYAKNIIRALTPGFSEESIVTTIFLTQIMYPFIFFISLSALIMGLLNVKNIFGIPALASSFFNIGSIIGGALIGWIIDSHFGIPALAGLAIGTLLGGALQLLVQLPSLWGIGYRFKPDFRWNDTEVRQVCALTIPGIIAASAVQINVCISSMFSSYLGAEAVTWLNSAFRLVQFPIGIFGVAVSTITLPILSRIAVRNDDNLLGDTLSKALRFVVFLTMPVVLFFFIFAQPLVSLIYEHGKFTPQDSIQTALALQAYAIGLIAYSCIKVLAPAFYAINKKWVPMMVSFTAVLLNSSLNYLFIFKLGMGHKSLALATALSALVNGAILFCLFARLYNIQFKLFISNLIYSGIASTIVTGLGLIILTHGVGLIYSPIFFIRVISLLSSFIILGSIYLSISLFFKLEGALIIYDAVSQQIRLYLKGFRPASPEDKAINN
ncbi:murein biosynthesis integral membrane protein MurJ [Legionella pneumophila]|nr:murein biosynthesis integral membrane protein MurJ [Legionella pneumophila]HAT6937499.1 murein biosynthesis integral membrane protein MurJ [Legionella pneumophila]HAU1656918.1 murein biosynthesis integral membrane protein MurJ [Legionella pneumophila]